MNIHSQLIGVLTFASRLEQDPGVPAADRQRAASIRAICETVKGTSFALRDYELAPLAPAPQQGPGNG